MKKVLRSFGYAFKGLVYATSTQLNFRIHLVATVLVFIAGFLLQISLDQWNWIAISICLVLVTEIFNTMIETLVDLISPGYNEKAGRIKDMSAAAVVIAALFALITALIIFVPRLLVLTHHAA